MLIIFDILLTMNRNEAHLDYWRLHDSRGYNEKETIDVRKIKIYKVYMYPRIW